VSLASYDTAEDVLIRNRVLMAKLARELTEHETVDARTPARLMEEYVVYEIHFEEPSLNGHQRR
jgi:cell division protease FtsH